MLRDIIIIIGIFSITEARFNNKQALVTTNNLGAYECISSKNNYDNILNITYFITIKKEYINKYHLELDNGIIISYLNKNCHNITDFFKIKKECINIYHVELGNGIIISILIIVSLFILN